VFEDGSRQNREYRVGRYRFYLARQWSTVLLVDGSYVLEVSVADVRGNVDDEHVVFATANV
jgi:hypothetical protein